MKGSKRRQLGEQQVCTKAAASGPSSWITVGHCRARCQEEFEGTLVSCKAPSRSMHKEILRYFSEICGMD